MGGDGVSLGLLGGRGSGISGRGAAEPRGGATTDRIHSLGHSEKARGFMTRHTTSYRRPNKRGTDGARETPSVTTAVLLHVNGAVRLAQDASQGDVGPL